MAYTVYILKSESRGIYYVGSTANIEARLQRHNQGRSKYTKSGVPWKVVYTEKFCTRSEAVKREQQIKGRKSREYIEGLVRTSR
jgi:putative endonuclease